MSEIKYDVFVKTGDLDCAGTDANVFINIVGKDGETGKTALAKSLAFRNKFERDQLDHFELTLKDVGDLTKCFIEHDNKGLGSSWYLDFVEVSIGGKPTVRFEANTWMEKATKDTTKLCLVP